MSAEFETPCFADSSLITQHSALDFAAREVVARFAVPCGPGALQALGNRGGFSGARLWRAETETGPLCLRAWPQHGPSAERLAGIHRLMRLARAAGLEFVPALHDTTEGASFVSHAERLWEVTDWKPGSADFHANASQARVEDACVALARLHQAWANEYGRGGACPAIERRLQHTKDWLGRGAAGWKVPQSSAEEPMHVLAQRAWQLVEPRLALLEKTLTPWLGRRVPLQPCLCDIWHDHVLFDGNRVSGLIDYGAVKIDNVAVDLARMLGSLVEDDVELRAAGLAAYATLRPLSLEEEALVPVLDEATTVLGAANWLKWLYVDKKQFENRDAVRARLEKLVGRIEGWD